MLPHGVVKSEMGADQKELAHYDGLQDFLYEAEVPGRHLSGRICLHSLRDWFVEISIDFRPERSWSTWRFLHPLTKALQIWPWPQCFTWFLVISSHPSNNQRFCDMEIAVIVGKDMKIFTHQQPKGNLLRFHHQTRIRNRNNMLGTVWRFTRAKNEFGWHLKHANNFAFCKIQGQFCGSRT